MLMYIQVISIQTILHTTMQYLTNDQVKFKASVNNFISLCFFILILNACQLGSTNELIEIKNTCHVNKESKTYITLEIDGKCNSFSTNTIVNPKFGGNESNPNIPELSPLFLFATNPRWSINEANKDWIEFEFSFVGEHEKPQNYELHIGKYDWANCSIWVNPDRNRENPRKGVVVHRNFSGLNLWSSHYYEQPSNSYFEITKIEPHENPDMTWITGKFSCSLSSSYNFDPKNKKSVYNGEFRTAIYKPNYVYKKVFGK